MYVDVEFYGKRLDETRSIETIRQAYEMGITLFDTADMYGYGHNEELIGKAIKDIRKNIIIATKFGIVRKQEDPHYRQISGGRSYIRQQRESSLKRLNIETIDLYYQHRVDPETPIDETIGAMAELVKEGKIRHIGLSEASTDIIRRAVKVHPITALQTEYSLWSRQPEEEILGLCKENNIGFVAYSPIGRGFLSGKFKNPEDLKSEGDFRSTLPRFRPGIVTYNASDSRLFSL